MSGRGSGLATVSLRRRVTIATVLVFVAVLVAVIVVVNAAFGAILNRSVTAVLNDHVQLAQQLARENTSPAVLVERLENREVQFREEVSGKDHAAIAVEQEGLHHGDLASVANRPRPGRRERTPAIILVSSGGPRKPPVRPSALDTPDGPRL